MAKMMRITENGVQVRPPPPSVAGNFTEALAAAVGAVVPADVALEHVNRPPAATTVSEIPVDLIDVSPSNPRSDVGDVSELAASITSLGVLQPVVVRVAAEGRYELVFGHRRLAAAKLAGLKAIPADVRDFTPVQVREAQLVENVQRDGITALEEADAYAELQKLAGYTGDQVALRVGKSRAWVYARMKLASLGPEGRRALAAEKIHPSVAVPLARLPTHALQAKAVTHLTRGDEPMSAAAAIEWLQKEFVRSLKGCPFPLKDEMLVAEAGACTTCPKNSAAATPGLFEDLSSGSWCTDTKCFDAKAAAHWEKRAEKAKAQGAEVLSPAEGRKLFKHDALPYNHRLVVASEVINEDSRKRSWADLVDKLPAEKRPKLHVAPDAKMRPVEMFDREEALKAFAEVLDLPWASARAEKVERQAKRADPEAAKTEEAARAVRERVIEEVVARAAAKVATTGFDLKSLRQLAAAALGVVGGHGSQAYFDALKVEKPEKWVAEKADAKALSGFIFWSFLSTHVGGGWTGYSDELLSLAEAFGFDVEKMTAANAATPVEETKKRKAGGR